MSEQFEEMALRIAREMDWQDFTDHGAASCVASHGCNGVSQSDLLEFARRLLALDGMVMVPREPTEAMLEAAEACANLNGGWYYVSKKAIYRVILDAALSAPAYRTTTSIRQVGEPS